MTFLLNEPLALILLILVLGFVLSLTISAKAPSAIRVVTLVTSLLALLVGVLSCFAFNKSDFGFQFITRLHLIPEYNLALTLGADGISMIFLLLTLFIFPILFLSAWNVTRQPKQFLNHLLGIEILLVLTFTALDIFYFYIFFESLLIPMFILIGVWGARERKIKAAYYFFLYTLFGSLFMLFGMIYLYFITGSTNFFVLLNSQLDAEQQKLIWLCFFLAFAVKMPLFPFHIWLPEAHVEAPTVGSMLLASLLLKLGGYGFLRFSLTFLAEGSHQFAPLVCTCSLLGVLYGSLSTLRQIDLKRIIAYSSVAHMNLVMLGLFSFNQQGLEGAVYLMVGHGVVSAALFFCVGVLYDRHHSRLLRYYGGLVAVMPLFAAFFLAFTLANMGFPGTSNFLGEVLVFLGIFAISGAVMLFASPGIVLSAAYSTWLYNRVTFGTLKTTYIREFIDLTRRETAVLATLLLSMLVLGLSANFILDFVQVALKGIIISSESNSFQQEPLLSFILLTGVGVKPAGPSLHANHTVNVRPCSEHAFRVSALFHHLKMPQVDTATFFPIVFWTFILYIAGFLLLNTTPLFAFLSSLKFNMLFFTGTYLTDTAMCCALLAIYPRFILPTLLTTNFAPRLTGYQNFEQTFSFNLSAGPYCLNAPKAGAAMFSTTSDDNAPVPADEQKTSVNLSVPPLSAYKHLLMSRTKHPGLYDKDASFFRRLITQHKPRPSAPYPWENTGRVVSFTATTVWITDMSLAKLGSFIYFRPESGEGPLVRGKVLRLEPRLRLVEVPQGHTVDKRDFVTLDRPHWYVEPSPQIRSE